MTQAPDPFGFTGFLIRRAQQAHAAVWAREVSGEVTSVQYGVLAALARTPGASQRDLCDTLDLDRSTIAVLVDRLERRGVIARERSPQDRRRYTITLTDAGESELAALQPRVHLVEAALTRFLWPEDVRALRGLLGEVLRSAASVGDGESTPPKDDDEAG